MRYVRFRFQGSNRKISTIDDEPQGENIGLHALQQGHEVRIYQSGQCGICLLLNLHDIYMHLLLAQ